MTIDAFVCCILLTIAISVGIVWICFLMDNASSIALTIIIGMAIIIGIWVGVKWYYGNTASGQRALVDQKSELNNGLERTITIYTADGEVIAKYTGVIDIEGNDGGYVIFDFEGKRYTYYNCFVESIANIE